MTGTCRYPKTDFGYLRTSVEKTKEEAVHKKKKIAGISVLLGIIVLVYLIFYLLEPTRFGSPQSVFILFQQSLIYSIAGCGCYFIIAMGLFDFSLGANLILSALVGCKLSHIYGYAGLVLGCLLVGAVIGVVNGAFYLKFRIPSIIVTVGLMMIYECIGVFIAGESTNKLAYDMKILGQAPWNLCVALIAFLFAMFLMNQTRMGVYIRAIGRNESMAKNMGVNTEKYKFLGFLLCGVFAGLTGMLTISYTSTMIPVQGMSSMARNFQPIMGCFVGLAFKKYVNPVISIAAAEFLISMIVSGVMTNGLDSTLQDCIIGMILLAIVIIMAKEERKNRTVVK